MVVAHGNIDAEVAQRLRQLSKRDPNTKVKALQVSNRQATLKSTKDICSMVKCFEHLYAVLANKACGFCRR